MLNENRNGNREQVGFYCMEDLVPKDHILRKIEKAIDFSFIYDLVKDRCSEDTDRPSMDPVVLFKIVFIQYLFGIRSMRQTIKEIEVNAAYRWLLELTGLSRFRISRHLRKTIRESLKVPIFLRRYFPKFCLKR